MINDPKQSQRINELAEEKVVVEWFRSTATIEESKIVNFNRLIPDAFCKAYYSEE